MHQDQVSTYIGHAPQVYADNVAMVPSVYGLKLTFGTIDDVKKTGAGQLERVIQREAVVRMGPKLAKQLAGLLAQFIEAYEKEEGAIKG